jgi:hypothetical protein
MCCFGADDHVSHGFGQDRTLGFNRALTYIVVLGLANKISCVRKAVAMWERSAYASRLAQLDDGIDESTVTE